ncbi:MAG: metallophosphoesterase [Victivallales bacterium]
MKPTESTDIIAGKNMRLLVLADDDDVIEALDKHEADILISCGDVADMTILRAAELSRCSRTFAVKGNHDSSSQFSPPILDLHLTVRTYCGISFGGFNGSWKYKPRGYFLYEQDEVEKLLALFPPVDVFVAHNSPRHIHDREDEIHIGFEAFTGYIKRTQPKLFLHGHQHSRKETVIGGTKVIAVYGQKQLELPLTRIV